MSTFLWQICLFSSAEVRQEFQTKICQMCAHHHGQLCSESLAWPQMEICSCGVGEHLLVGVNIPPAESALWWWDVHSCVSSCPRTGPDQWHVPLENKAQTHSPIYKTRLFSLENVNISLANMPVFFSWREARVSDQTLKVLFTVVSLWLCRLHDKLRSSGSNGRTRPKIWQSIRAISTQVKKERVSSRERFCWKNLESI